MRERHVSAYFVIALIMALAWTDFADAQRAREGRGRTPEPGTVLRIEWSDDGKSVSYTNQGRRFRLDLETLQKEDLEADDREPPRRRGRFRRHSTQF